MKTTTYTLKLLSSLVKVFPDEEPVYQPECLPLSALAGETVSFQAAYHSSTSFKEKLTVHIDSPLRDMIHIRSVEVVPVGLACNAKTDDNYLRTSSGLYPDLLKEIPDCIVWAHTNQWQSLWIDLIVPFTCESGTYPLTVELRKDGTVVCKKSMKITLYNVKLPHLDLMHTEWFYADCLASYYHVDIFSEAHWKLIENYLHEYTSRCCNMIYTPLFTPPLSMEVGGDRPTLQLIGVTLENGSYTFDFSKFRRWVTLCQNCGIEYFEMSHLFSQWGAKYPPKVIATVDGKEEKIFGWHTPVTGAYAHFLHCFIPELIHELKALHIDKKTVFHISDEPREHHLNTYKTAHDIVAELLKDYDTMDALSSYEFYKHGLVDKPIPGNNEIAEFFAHGLTNMWVYYCTAQCVDVSNRFMSMPSSRNRIYGIQIYKYDIIGILHWGYNFYYDHYSTHCLDPYAVTDAEYAFPSGDSFLVYPGEDGYPLESIRMMVHYHALCDYRALKLLESLTDKEYVLHLIEDELVEPLTFTTFPKSDFYLISLRNKVNAEIAKRVL